MRIKKENQLGLNFTQEIKDKFYQIHSDKFFSQFNEEELKPFKEQWKWILDDSQNKNLLFTKTAIEVCKKIKVDKFKPSILKIKTPKKYTFLIDDKHFYRVFLNGSEILVLHIKKEDLANGQSYLSYDSFKILPNENRVVYPPNQNDYLNDKHFVEFIKLLIFTEYSELQEVVIKPNQSYGTKKQGKYLNETSQNFVLVDSTWNSIIIRKDGFGVIGHFRLQPIGKNREDRKLIYISEFFKNGYIRNAKRDNQVN